jgi:hypothetical protein
MNGLALRKRIRRIGPALALVLANACATTTRSFRFTGDGMREAFESWRRTATPKTRSTIDALDEDPSILIHIIRGRIDVESRGGATTLAGFPPARKQCILHPSAPGVRWNRNFDIIYDEDQQRRMAKRLGFETPIEAILQHEVMGHIIPVIVNPALATRSVEETEREAVLQENEYRGHVGLPLMPLPPDKTKGVGP